MNLTDALKVSEVEQTLDDLRDGIRWRQEGKAKIMFEGVEYLAYLSADKKILIGTKGNKFNVLRGDEYVYIGSLMDWEPVC